MLIKIYLLCILKTCCELSLTIIDTIESSLTIIDTICRVSARTLETRHVICVRSPYLVIIVVKACDSSRALSM